MPRVMRRTPATEKAMEYGYRSFLQDIGAQAGRNVARMTSGGLGKEELLEMALAPAGGMLKAAGTGKLLAGLLASQRRALVFKKASEVGEHPIYSSLKGQTEREIAKHFAPTQRVFKEALKVPEKEYRRIKDIKWGSMAGEVAGTKGLYDPYRKEIRLRPGLEDLETVWHEFVHARQWSPQKGSKLPGGESEAEAARTLKELAWRLEAVTKSTGMSSQEFYHSISPIERQARGVAFGTVKFPKDFETIYKFALKKEVATSRRKLHNLLKKLEKDKAFMRGETEIQMALRDIAKIPKEAKSLMKTFSKQGLKYDVFTEPLPGYGYHQWTFYGEGPLKGATFGTKTTGLGEMEAKVTDMMKKFSKEGK